MAQRRGYLNHQSSPTTEETSERRHWNCYLHLMHCLWELLNELLLVTMNVYSMNEIEKMKWTFSLLLDVLSGQSVSWSCVMVVDLSTVYVSVFLHVPQIL